MCPTPRITCILQCIALRSLGVRQPQLIRLRHSGPAHNPNSRQIRMGAAHTLGVAVRMKMTIITGPTTIIIIIITTIIMTERGTRGSRVLRRARIFGMVQSIQKLLLRVLRLLHVVSLLLLYSLQVS